MDSASNHGDVDELTGEDGLIFGCLLDGAGGGRLVGWREVEAWTSAEGVLWLHLDRTSEKVAGWLRTTLRLGESATTLLISNETRPRTLRQGEGLLTILRGVNFNPQSDPDDMIAMQIWATSSLVVTLRRRRLMTPRDMLRRLVETGDGPKTAGELFSGLAERLIERMNSVITQINDCLADIEPLVQVADVQEVRGRIASARHDCVGLRRYMAPQRDALSQILIEAPPWLSEIDRAVLRETADRLQRYLEELDVARETALVLHDEVDNRVSTEMNRTMYMLSVVAVIFLPLSFITGLLGINVGGMPGINSGVAFTIVVVLLIALFAVELAILRWLKWL